MTAIPLKTRAFLFVCFRPRSLPLVYIQQKRGYYFGVLFRGGVFNDFDAEFAAGLPLDVTDKPVRLLID